MQFLPIIYKLARALRSHETPRIGARSFIKQLFILVPAMLLTLVIFAPEVVAAAEIFKTTGLCRFFPCPEGDTGTEVAKNLAVRIVGNVRVIIGAIAIFMIIIAGVKLVTSSGNEEVFTKQMHTLIYGVLGLFIIGLAGELAQIFEVDRGGFLKDPNTMLQKSILYNRTLKIIITFIKYIIGSIAVLFIVRNALRLVLLGGNEDEVGKDKKNIFYALLGLTVIFISNPIINKVFFKIDTSKFPGVEAVRPGIDAGRFIQEVAGMTNLVASIAGPFALLSLVAGGLMYTFGAGNDEMTGKAKKIIMWSIIGLVVIYGAFAIVSTFVAREFTGI